MRPVDRADAPVAVIASTPVARAAVAAPAHPSAAAPARVGTLRYALCGTLQLLFVLGYPTLIGFAVVRGYEWVITATAPIDVYLRAAMAVALPSSG